MGLDDFCSCLCRIKLMSGERRNRDSSADMPSLTVVLISYVILYNFISPLDVCRYLQEDESWQWISTPLQG